MTAALIAGLGLATGLLLILSGAFPRSSTGSAQGTTTPRRSRASTACSDDRGRNPPSGLGSRWLPPPTSE